MADELLDTLIKQALADAPSQGMRPATSDPILDRAVWKLQKDNPSIIGHSDISTMPWTDPDSGTNTLGKTDVKQGRQKIQINPAETLTFPQPLIESTLVHELEHARSNREAPMGILESILEHAKAYENRDHEKAAFAKSREYLKNVYGVDSDTKVWNTDPEVFTALPLKSNYQIPSSFTKR